VTPLDISETVQAELIIAIGGVVVALIGLVAAIVSAHRATQARDHAADTKAEVTNGHPDNIRDQMDAIAKAVADLTSRINGSEYDTRVLRGEVICMRNGCERREPPPHSPPPPAPQRAA